MKVKVSFGTDIRIWRNKGESFENLVTFVQNSFEQLNEDFLITYEDDEGDRVTIIDDDDLEEAVELYKSLNKRSLKVFIVLKKNAHRIDNEPGAFEPEAKPTATMSTVLVNEIVSEPGGGLDNEEKEDVLATNFMNGGAAPEERNNNSILRSSIQSDQIEGSPAKQSIMYWMHSLLPLLAKHGITEELKSGIPDMFTALENGDDFGTAIQICIARCPLLQEQGPVKEFMTHVQANVAPLSNEIVPHVLTLGCSGFMDMIDRLSDVSRKWANGIQDIKFDISPFISKIWPAAFERLEKDQTSPCELLLNTLMLKGNFSNIVKNREDPDTKINTPTPFEDTPTQSTLNRFRLVEEDNSWKKKQTTFEKKNSWDRGPRYSGHRRGRGRGKHWRSHNRPHRGGGFHSDPFGPYSQIHDEPWYNHTPSHPPPPSHTPSHHHYPKEHYGLPPSSNSHQYYGGSSTKQSISDHNGAHHHHHYHHPPPGPYASFEESTKTKRDDYLGGGPPPKTRNSSRRGDPARDWDMPSSPRNSRTKGGPHRDSRRYDYPSDSQRRSESRLEQPKKEIRVSATPLKAEFVDHVNIPLRSKYLSGIKLLKKWCVRNVGTEPWDERVTLEFTKGDDSLPTKKVYSVPHCDSGQLCELSALIETPQKPGRYTAYFRLNRGDTNFGPRIWVDIYVVATEEELTETDDQTQKRLQRIDNRASATRPSQRRSQTKLRSSQRRSKTKKNNNTINVDLETGQSGMGFVDVPIFESRNSFGPHDSYTARGSTLNKDAQEFRPSMKRDEDKYGMRKGHYAEQLKELQNMGFPEDERIRTLLEHAKGDLTKVIEVLVK